jgi:predicted permease
MNGLWLRIHRLLRSSAYDKEVGDEFRFHVEMETEKNIRLGMSPREARRVALVAFGGVDRYAEAARQARGAVLLGDSLRDLRLSVRGFRRSPGFVVVVVLTLAFGIGANAAVFRALETLSLTSLPVHEPQRLATLELTDMTRWEGRRTSQYPVLSNAIWERLRAEDGPFEEAFAWANAAFMVESTGAKEQVRGLYVSGDFFNALGVGATGGRTFRADDDRPACPLVGAVISHGFWERAFGGDPTVLGRQITVNSRQIPVIGVSEPGFGGLEVGRPYDLAVPICAQRELGGDEQWLEDGTVWWLTVMGRIPQGTTLAGVNAELKTRSRALFEATLPADYADDQVEDYLSLELRAVSGETGLSNLRTRYEDALIALLGVTGLILLIVCMNISNLFLARGSAREREFAVRRALGASRGRVFRELAVESAVLAAAGAVCGAAVAWLASRHLLGLLGSDLSLDLSFGSQTLALIAGTAVASVTVFGLIPAWRTAQRNTDGGGRLVRGARGAATYAATGLQKGLVVSQVAVSFVLLFGAILFVGTLRNLLSVDMGFDPDPVSVARIDFSALDLAAEQRPTFKKELLERIEAIPRVSSVAEVRHVPLGGTGSSATVRTGADRFDAGTPIRMNAVTPDYAETMGIPLIAGRWFGPADGPDAGVAIVTESLADRLQLGDDPLGAVLQIMGSEGRLQVVGLIPDAKYFSLREEPVPTAFVPKDLLPDTRSFTDFVIRTSLPVPDLEEGVRRAAEALGSQVWTNVHRFDDTVRDGLLRERLMSSLAGFFGILAALVAAVGLYGVISYQVSRRRGEIGVRLALGAEPNNILAIVFREAGTLLLLGLVSGAVVAYLAAIPARALLFGLDGSSALAHVLTAALLCLTAAFACYVPARRAARLEPRTAVAAAE